MLIKLDKFNDKLKFKCEYVQVYLTGDDPCEF